MSFHTHHLVEFVSDENKLTTINVDLITMIQPEGSEKTCIWFYDDTYLIVIEPYGDVIARLSTAPAEG